MCSELCVDSVRVRARVRVCVHVSRVVSLIRMLACYSGSCSSVSHIE